MIATDNEHQWALETSAAIREGRLSDVDLEQVAQYISSIASGHKREFISRLRNAMLNDMTGDKPEAEHELNYLRYLLEQYPTLATAVTQADIDHAYGEAITIYMIDEAASRPPTTHRYSIRAILDETHLPPVP